MAWVVYTFWLLWIVLFELKYTNTCFSPCFHFFEYIPWNGIAGSYGNFIFSFLRNPHSLFHSSCRIILYSHQQCSGGPVSPHPSNTRSHALLLWLPEEDTECGRLRLEWEGRPSKYPRNLGLSKAVTGWGSGTSIRRESSSVLRFRAGSTAQARGLGVVGLLASRTSSAPALAFQQASLCC